jgi:biotin operon repressor
VPEAELETLLAFFKAMANESRLRIVGLIAERERSGQELAELLELKEPTVSHHIAQLKALGLVSVRNEGVTNWYRLRPEALTGFNKALLAPKDATALVAGTPSFDDKIIATFVGPDGKVANLPASRRKRWILERWMMSAFEEGRDYPEREVNEILQRWHWDCATLRREMIGYHMLARESDVYRRLPESEWREHDDRRPL